MADTGGIPEFETCWAELAPVDWLIDQEHTAARIDAVRAARRDWPGAGERKLKLFDNKLIGLALVRLQSAELGRSQAR